MNTKTINDFSLDELYQIYLRRNRWLLERIVSATKVTELKQFAKDNSLSWYQGSKTSFLQELLIAMAHRKAIVGDSFRG